MKKIALFLYVSLLLISLYSYAQSTSVDTSYKLTDNALHLRIIERTLIDTIVSHSGYIHVYSNYISTTDDTPYREGLSFEESDSLEQGLLILKTAPPKLIEAYIDPQNPFKKKDIYTQRTYTKNNYTEKTFVKSEIKIFLVVMILFLIIIMAIKTLNNIPAKGILGWDTKPKNYWIGFESIDLYIIWILFLFDCVTQFFTGSNAFTAICCLAAIAMSAFLGYFNKISEEGSVFVAIGIIKVLLLYNLLVGVNMQIYTWWYIPAYFTALHFLSFLIFYIVFKNKKSNSPVEIEELSGT